MTANVSNRGVVENPFLRRRSRYLFFCLVSGLLLIMLLAASASVVLAAGGDPVSPFPTRDARVGRQEATASAVDAAGNVIVAGYQNLTGTTDDDFWTVKINADGSVAWRAAYNMAGGSDRIAAVATDAGGDVIVAGYAWNGTNYDIHTIKYNGSSGAVVWEDTFAGAAGGNDIATAIAVDNANGLVYVAGYSQNGSGNDDFLVLKYANSTSGPANPPTATVIYNGTANGPDRIKAIAANASGFVATGESWNGSDFDSLTVQYNLSAAKVHEWRYSSSGSHPDAGRAVAFDPSGNIIVVAVVTTDMDKDIYTARYDASTGATLWAKTFNGGFDDEPAALFADADGDVYLTGYTWTLAGHEDFYVARRVGSTGEIVWEKKINSAGENADIAVGITAGAGATGGVFVTGYSVTTVSDDILTLKLKKDNGNLLWEKRYDGDAHRNDRPAGIGLAPSGNVCVAGWSDAWTGGAADYDYVALVYDFGPLDAPTDLAASATSNTAIQLTWTDNSGNEDGFKIERKLGDDGVWSQINTVGAGVTTYNDTGLVANNYYYYRVRAYNAGNGNSAYSDEAHALTKVVSYDTPAWSYSYNGPNNNEDYATAIAVGPDDHPVVTGYSNLEEEGVPGSYSNDYFTVKLDRADKSVKWTARYDSGSGGMDRATAVAVLPDNDVVVSGNAYLSGAGGVDSDEIYTLKYPATAPIPEQWNDQFGREGSDRASTIAVATDASKSIVVAGYGMNSSANDDIYIIKYNADGSRPWVPAVYDSGRNEYPTAVALDGAGNIFVTGYTVSAAGDTDWFTAKYGGATGALVWSDTVDGAGHGNDYARSLAVDAAGNVYVTGYIVNAGGTTDFYTIKYDGADSSTQRRIWEKSYNGPNNGNDKGMALKIDSIDGAVVVAGTSETGPGDHDFHLIRYNQADGSVIWERNFDRPGKEDYVSAMAVDSSGYIYVAGNSRNGPDYDVSYDASSDILSLIYNHEGTFLGAVLYDATGLQDEAEAITVNYRGEAFIAGFSKNASGNADYLVLKQTNPYILVPAPFTATPQPDYTRVNLEWRENTAGTSFRIWRAPGPSTPTTDWGSPIYTGASGTTTFQDSGLGADTNYCYRIEAYVGSINSRRIETCVTTTIPAPTLAAPHVVSTSRIDLSWNNVADNTGYRIERKVEAGSWSTLATTAGGVAAYSDTGLTAGTLYTYRISSQNASGYSSASNEASATTIPATPTLNAPTGITDSQVTLTWSNVSGETGYKIDRKEGAGGVWSQIGTAGQDVLTYNDSGLMLNTQYYYRLRASNAAGDSAYGNEQGALTLFTSPTLSSAAGAATTEIDLSWSAVAGATGYTIQESGCNYDGGSSDTSYCTAANTAWAWGGWYTLTTVGAGVTTYQRTGLPAGYAYRYRVIANVTGNSSAPSNEIIAWSWLTAPTVSIAPASETSLAVSWNDILGETNYTLDRKLGTGGTWGEVTGAIGMAANSTAFTDTGLALQSQYCYRVKAYSTLPGNPPPAYSGEQCMYTPLPAPVLNAPTSPSTSQIDLSWNNVTGNTGYEVQMRTLQSYPDNPEYAVYDWAWGGWTTVATLPADTTTYSGTGLATGYTYQFVVRDLYSGGNSAWSNAQTLTTLPAAPSISGVSAASTTQLNISWNNVYGETSYKLDWKAGAGGSWSTITVGENATSYAHGGLTPDTVYYYRIRATSSGGDSDYSAETSQVTSLPVLDPLAGITASKIDLSWSNISGNTSYIIERQVEGGAWAQLTTVGQDVTTYSDTGLTAGTLYGYRVRVVNASGTSAPSNERSATTAPPATTATAAVISSAEIAVSWPVVTGATHYKVEQKPGSGGSWSEIADVAATYGTSYCGYAVPRIDCTSPTPNIAGTTSSGLTENTQYCFQVKAVNSGGESAPSPQVCVTTSALANQNLTLTPLNAFKVRLDWSALECAPNPCDTPQGYEIEVLVRNGIWAPVATVPATPLTYTDTVGLEPQKIYRYRIRAFNGTDSSPYSEGTVTTPAYVQGDGTCP
ncbi:fibronectin type III domain-containing protein [Geobacter sp.]|uniref:fibronectin type III domain-containing protein n=1 Tax=Geobacter sp. TaxID=46610 RepID=UPI00260ED57B|nr:fibronectin type III domain-containing protein [Geobacter sp.]